MSFGVGIGDVVLVTNLAWKLYKSCKESSEDFRRISNELALLHVALGETQDYLNEHSGQLADSRRNRYQILMDNCRVPLEDLHALLGRYESLNTQSQRTWDRMRFGLKDLAEIRQRLVEITTQLSCFNTMLIKCVVFSFSVSCFSSLLPDYYLPQLVHHANREKAHQVHPGGAGWDARGIRGHGPRRRA